MRASRETLKLNYRPARRASTPHEKTAAMPATPSPSAPLPCPLCAPDAETVVWADESCRVIRVDEHDFAGFCRVVWREHVAELSDLPVPAQRHLMNVVCAVELALRQLMQPAKVNLASLGNMVPHLHWHVIPRFTDDSRFPDPVWASARRTGAVRQAPSVAQLNEAITQSLNELTAG